MLRPQPLRYRVPGALTKILVALQLLVGAADCVAETVQVRAPRANVRAAPSGTATIIGRVEQGASLDVVERRGGWVRVRGGSLPHVDEAWVHSSLLADAAGKSPTGMARSWLSEDMMQIGAESALLVSEPRDGSRPVAVLHRGELVIVVTRRGEWAHVFSPRIYDPKTPTGAGSAWIKAADLAPSAAPYPSSGFSPAPAQPDPYAAPELRLPPASRNLTIGQPSLRCRESILGQGGFERCDLAFLVTMTSSRAESLTMNLRCEAVLATEYSDGMLPGKASETYFGSIYVGGGHGSSMISMSISVRSLFTFSEVVRVRLSDLQCRAAEY